MQGVTSQRQVPDRGDGIVHSGQDYFIITSAALTKTVNPSKDVTSFDFDNLEGALPLRIQLFGRDAAGLAVQLGDDLFALPAASQDRNYKEVIKVNSSDLSQRCDYYVLTVMKGDRSAPAVAADVVVGWTFVSSFNNQ